MIRKASQLALPLLLDPRGRIDRRSFAEGLGLLAVLVILTVVAAGLARQHWAEAGETLGVASLPLLSVMVLAEPAWTLAYAGAVAIVGFRLWCLGCLALKRLRHAGHAPWPVICVAFATVGIDLGFMRWISLEREGLQGADQLGLSVFWLFACALKATIWAMALIWIGSRPSGSTAAARNPAASRDRQTSRF